MHDRREALTLHSVELSGRMQEWYSLRYHWIVRGQRYPECFFAIDKTSRIRGRCFSNGGPWKSSIEQYARRFHGLQRKRFNRQSMGLPSGTEAIMCAH